MVDGWLEASWKQISWLGANIQTARFGNRRVVQPDQINPYRARHVQPRETAPSLGLLSQSLGITWDL